jgi:hypothetical protein
MELKKENIKEPKSTETNSNLVKVLFRNKLGGWG